MSIIVSVACYVKLGDFWQFPSDKEFYQHNEANGTSYGGTDRACLGKSRQVPLVLSLDGHDHSAGSGSNSQNRNKTEYTGYDPRYHACYAKTLGLNGFTGGYIYGVSIISTFCCVYIFLDSLSRIIIIFAYSGSWLNIAFSLGSFPDDGFFFYFAVSLILNGSCDLLGYCSLGSNERLDLAAGDAELSHVSCLSTGTLPTDHLRNIFCHLIFSRPKLLFSRHYDRCQKQIKEQEDNAEYNTQYT